MKRQFLAILFLTAATGHVSAQSDVYLCIAENGNKEYKNIGATKGCKKIDLPGLTTIPAPARKPLMQTAAAKPSSLGSDFPRVDSDTQKTRDSDRRQILQDEMKSEEQKLSDLKKEFNNGEPERKGDERDFAKYRERVASIKENMVRTEKNIEALKREIGNSK